MAYRGLLIVPMNLPNWLLVLPPKNGFNTCSESIQVFWSNSIDLIWSSKFKIMVNSNLRLIQLWFTIPVAAHAWCDYGQNHLTPLPNSIRLWQILEISYFQHTSSNFQQFKVSWTLPLYFCDGLWAYYLLTVRSPWLNYKSWSVFFLRLSNGFSKKSVVYPHNCGEPVQILRLCIRVGLPFHFWMHVLTQKF
jgi:hypothetical protein